MSENQVIEMFAAMDATQYNESSTGFIPTKGSYQLLLAPNAVSTKPWEFTKQSGEKVSVPSLSFRWTIIGGPDDGKSFFEDRYQPQDPNEPGLEEKARKARTGELERLKGNLRVLTGMDEVTNFGAAILTLIESLKESETGIIVNGRINTYTNNKGYTRVNVYANELVSAE